MGRLELLVGESLYAIVTAWRRFVPEEDWSEREPIPIHEIVPKILSRPFVQGGQDARPVSEVLALGNRSLREAQRILSLRDMLPERAGLLPRFMSLSNWTNSLESNQRYLEHLVTNPQADEMNYENDVIAEPDMRLYMTKGAVLTHAQRVLELAEDIRVEVETMRENAELRLGEMEKTVGQAWLEGIRERLVGPVPRDS